MKSITHSIKARNWAGISSCELQPSSLMRAIPIREGILLFLEADSPSWKLILLARP